MKTIAVIGLGYVGLPLAVTIGKSYQTIGFDINSNRIEELKRGIDRTLEVSIDELQEVDQLIFSSDASRLKSADWYIVTVPTPIDQSKQPDLSPLLSASELVGRSLNKGNVVIYESTVYPGCTEEFCVPILERSSGLTYNQDFFCGYSPERINPGDKEHKLPSILKVTSGSTNAVASEIDAFYAGFISAGTYLASSIKVAEAAKVIENAQRDINIAFINELAQIFQKLGLDTQEVLDAAGTKWNFLPFKPGLVGGHCIGVDPYYLAHKAEALGYQPQVILSGRKVNDGMGAFVAQQVVKQMAHKKTLNAKSKVLILGITFKENCPDIRNTRVVDIIHELEQYQISVDIFDPQANPEEVYNEYNFELLADISNWEDYDAVILAVSHKEFENLDWQQISNMVEVIYDVKGMIPKGLSTGRL
ncbi:MAG: UDP-N-acetyl-D-galactosamine dehydrogenase [Marinoscillum sp.]|jgi:UDP-N-acetyl-D-galactosamine dehydrogenase